MAGNQITRFLKMTATQGGADTFVQASVATDIIPEEGLVYKITGIDVQINSGIQAISADCSFYWSFTRDTKTALAPLSDDDCLLLDGFCVSLTTSGQVYLPATYRYANLGLYLVEPIVYVQLSTTATGITNAINTRIYYEEVKMSEVEILRILNNS